MPLTASIRRSLHLQSVDQLWIRPFISEGTLTSANTKLMMSEMREAGWASAAECSRNSEHVCPSAPSELVHIKFRENLHEIGFLCCYRACFCLLQDLVALCQPDPQEIALSIAKLCAALETSWRRSWSTLGRSTCDEQCAKPTPICAAAMMKLRAHYHDACREEKGCVSAHNPEISVRCYHTHQHQNC